MAKPLTPAVAKKKAGKLFKEKRWPAAQKLYSQLCQVMPEDHNIWLNLGITQSQLADFQQAEFSFRRALDLRPNLVAAYEQLGPLLSSQNRFTEAEAVYRIYIRLAPDSSEAFYRMGRLLNLQGKYPEAIEIFDKALELGCRDKEIYLFLGQALTSVKRYDEAIETYHKAIDLSPESAAPVFGLGAVYRFLGKFDLAEDYCRKALAVNPEEKLEYLMNVARLSECKGEYEQALGYLDEIMECYPDALGVRTWHAESLLRLGHFQKGWAQYEWRQKHPAWLSAMGGCEFSMPRWDGSSLAKKTILIYTEQGFGDALQFGRYLQVLNDQGAIIIFYCDKELVSLFQCLPFLERVEAKSYHKALKEKTDFHAALMSLPHLCGTTLENIPSCIPYFKVGDELNNYWKARIQPDGLRVGLVWAGRPTHLRDSLRSCGLRELLPLLSVENVSFYSLQKGEAVSQIKALSLEGRLADLSEELNDFSATAAVINNLDLVITVDTAVAHLAGALGCQVWTLIYSPPEWRWMLGRDDSPWYPTMSLFRQSDIGGWEQVVRRIASALAELAAESSISK